MKKQINIKKDSDGLWILGDVGFGIILSIPATILFTENFFGGLLCLLFIFKFFIYNILDFLFDKQIIKTDNNLFIKISKLRLAIDTERAYIEISKVDTPVTGFTKVKGIVLVRNNKKIKNRLFKNRIKLLAEGKNKNLEEFGEKLSSELGIKFVGELKL